MERRSGEERRLWIAAAALLVAIWSSAYFVQFALDALRERNLLRVTIAGAALVVAIAVAAPMVRRRAGAREWAALVGVALVYAAVASRLHIVQERVHLIEYGAVAWLFRGALAAHARAAPGVRDALLVWGGAFGLASLGGLADEAIQGILPNRHWDLRDVGLNALSAALALGSTALLGAARRADGGAA